MHDPVPPEQNWPAAFNEETSEWKQYSDVPIEARGSLETWLLFIAARIFLPLCCFEILHSAGARRRKGCFLTRQGTTILDIDLDVLYQSQLYSFLYEKSHGSVVSVSCVKRVSFKT